MEVLSHPDLVRLHPTGHHPDTPRRIEVLLDSVGEFGEAGPATEEQVAALPLAAVHREARVA